MRNRVPVTIDGEDYTLVGEGDQQTIEKIAALVDERIRQVRQMPGISVKQALRAGRVATWRRSGSAPVRPATICARR